MGQAHAFRKTTNHDQWEPESGVGSLATVEVDLGGPVNLAATLECGQAFRWRKACFPGRPDLVAAYTGVIPVGRTTGTARREIVSASEIAPCSRITPRQLAVYVGQAEPVTSKIMVAYDPTYAQDDTGLAEPQPCACSHGEQPADPPPVGHISDAVRLYFAADDDVAAIEAEVARLDSVMAGAVKEAHGLRILRQDHWECLASYVLSINNNIPNISRIVEHFSLCLGEPVGLGLHSFPPPEKIACQDSGFLRQSKCGFRDRYLKDAAERVASGEVDLTGLERMPTEQARERLMRIRGVGPKVADCVLLFGYHRLDVFPSDVWISRAMSRYYLGGGAVTPKMAREEGMRRFGPLAGYAQEYLFWRARGDDSLR